MELLSESLVTPELGVVGDYRGRAKPNGRPSRRQVSVLRREDWAEAEAELADELPWTMRRANLMVEGVAIPRRPGS
jgi:MOSC domain-containing protein YiiM